MALGELTKQLAQQAFSNQMKDVLDAKPGSPAPTDNVGSTILGQIQAMQNALKEDQELLILVSAGAELIRVLEVFAPSWRVVVLTGVCDAEVESDLVEERRVGQRQATARLRLGSVLNKKMNQRVT